MYVVLCIRKEYYHDDAIFQGVLDQNCVCVCVLLETAPRHKALLQCIRALCDGTTVEWINNKSEFVYYELESHGTSTISQPSRIHYGTLWGKEMRTTWA